MYLVKVAMTQKMATLDLQMPSTTKYPHENDGATLIAICAVLLVLETAFVGLRYYARHLTTAGLGQVDLVIFVAWLSNIGLCILCIGQYCPPQDFRPLNRSANLVAVREAGAAQHLAYVIQHHPAQTGAFAKCLFALEWLYLASCSLPKISILVFYLRIFTKRHTRLTCYFLIVFVCASWVAYLIAAHLQCMPLAYLWNKSIHGGHCFNLQASYKSSSVPNIVTDAVMIFLPIPTVIALQVALIKKIGLIFVFLVGSV